MSVWADQARTEHPRFVAMLADGPAVAAFRAHALREFSDLPDSDVPVPSDGTSTGELQCRGPWIAATYYHDPRADESFTSDGWLRTGDVATMDERGRIRLVDRTKDLIKSGGEWI